MLNNKGIKWMVRKGYCMKCIDIKLQQYAHKVFTENTDEASLLRKEWKKEHRKELEEYKKNLEIKQKGEYVEK